MIQKLDLLEKNLPIYPYKLLEPYALRQRARINQIVRQLLSDPPKRLLVLDDGSYFLESLVCFEATFPQVAVVEQTTRGLIKLKKSAVLRNKAAQTPIIAVASSEPKSYLEPPFIAKAVIRNLHDKFRKLSFSPWDKSVLILCYGNIGSSVERFFKP